jgi:hypothetical protein
MEVAEALAAIDGLYEVVLGFEPEDGALSYYPDIDPVFNTLRLMKPGYGYWIKMERAATLRYPSGGAGEQGTGGAGEQGSGGAEEPESRGVGGRRSEVVPTSAWVNLYGPARNGDGAPLAAGTTVLALDPDGVVCGAAQVAVEGRYGLLPCYRDDPATPEDEGPRPGDPIQLVVEGAVLGQSVWTAHGERQRVALGGGSPGSHAIYLPLIVRAGGDP